MRSRIIHVGLIGKTNSGKSTFINSIVGEKISIENKKINTTQESVTGILNVKNTQIIFYDTPGLILLKKNNIIQKKQNTELWEAINNVDLILFIIDIVTFNNYNTVNAIEKIKEVKKPVIVVFNKIDLIKKEIILLYIKKLNETKLIDDFFNISANNIIFSVDKSNAFNHIFLLSKKLLIFDNCIKPFYIWMMSKYLLKYLFNSEY